MELTLNGTPIRIDPIAAQEIVRRHLLGVVDEPSGGEALAMCKKWDDSMVLTRTGEKYIGSYAGPDGKLTHAFLRPEKKEGVTWDQAMAFAKDLGYDAPNREEGLLLFRHHRDQFKKDDVLWLNEQLADDSSYAWTQYFFNGYQYGWHKDGKLLARAVRRVTI